MTATLAVRGTDFMILTRRKFHLSVLRSACEERSTARVAAISASAASEGAPTRFVALAPDGVLLEWPQAGAEQIPCSGALVDVRFVYRSTKLSFRTETIGRVWWATPGHGESDCWKLRIPLCLIPARLEPERRIDLPAHDSIVLRCTSVADAQAHFTARLEALTTDGLTARADAVCQELCTPGAIFWAQFQIPQDPIPLEFVVRISTARPEPGTRVMVFRGDFCPADDPALAAEQLTRLVRRLRSPGRVADAAGGSQQVLELERC